MRYTTAGETRGQGFVVIVEGVPTGLRIRQDSIYADLDRWAQRYGANPRALGRVEVLSGIRDGRTTGAAVALALDNQDYLASGGSADPAITVARPGTADLSAALKSDADDCAINRDATSANARILRLAAAGIAREFLAEMGVEIHSYVSRIGAVSLRDEAYSAHQLAYEPLDIEISSVRCPSPQVTRLMEAAIDEAAAQGETLGGRFCCVITGLVPGLGGLLGAPANLKSRLSGALFAVDGVLGVEFGRGSELSQQLGGAFIDYAERDRRLGFARTTNVLGGIEGGMASGMPVVMHADVAPSTDLGKKVAGLDMQTLSAAFAQAVDYAPCDVASRAVEAEAELAFALTEAYLEAFGSGSLTDIQAAVRAYEHRLAFSTR